MVVGGDGCWQWLLAMVVVVGVAVVIVGNGCW